MRRFERCQTAGHQGILGVHNLHDPTFQNRTSGRSFPHFLPQLKLGQLHVYLAREGTIICHEIRNITRQKPYDTVFFERVASASKVKLRKAKVKHKIRFRSSASDGCSTLYMKPEKSAKLTQEQNTLRQVLNC